MTYNRTLLKKYANLSLEEEYDENRCFRFVYSFDKKNNLRLSEPIYKFLIDRSNFSNLLHEVYLYIFGTSLKLEKPDIYNQALKLYRTRNKLVHLNKIPDKNTEAFFSLNNTETKEAFHTVLDIYKWLNINSFEIFRLPPEFIILNPSEEFMNLTDEEGRVSIRINLNNVVSKQRSHSSYFEENK